MAPIKPRFYHWSNLHHRRPHSLIYNTMPSARPLTVATLGARHYEVRDQELNGPTRPIPVSRVATILRRLHVGKQPMNK